MKRLDLISDALDGITNGNYNPRLTKEALAAARALRELEPVARMSKMGHVTSDLDVGGKSYINLYALGDEK